MGAYAPNRISKDDADKIKSAVVKILSDNNIKVFLAGSYRRHSKDFGDLDFIIIDTPLSKVKSLLSSSLNIDKIARSGESVVSYVINHNDKLVQIETTYTTSAAFGAALLHSTGNSNFNIALRSHAKHHGLKLNQYGLFQENKLITSKTEEDIFKKLNLRMIPVSDRSPKDINSAYNVLKKYKIPNNSGSTMNNESFEHGIKTLKNNKSVFDVKKSQYFRDPDLFIDFVNTTISDDKLQVVVSRRKTSLADLKKSKGIVRTNISNPFVTKVEVFSNVTDLRNVWGDKFLDNFADAIYKAANNPVSPTASDTKKEVADPQDVTLANNISNPKSVDALNNLLKLVNLNKEDYSSADTLKFISSNSGNVLAMSADVWHKYFKKYDPTGKIRVFYQGSYRDGDTKSVKGGFTLVFMKYDDFNKMRTPYDISFRRNNDGIYLINKFRDVRLDSTASSVLFMKGQGQTKPIKLRRNDIGAMFVDKTNSTPSFREATTMGFSGTATEYAGVLYSIKLFVEKFGTSLTTKYKFDSLDQFKQYLIEMTISNYEHLIQQDFVLDNSGSRQGDDEIFTELRKFLLKD